jgi:predicted transcriptional regulator
LGEGTGHGSLLDAISSQNARVAESTVRTILSRLEKKGAVDHTVDDRTFIFRPLVQSESVRQTATRAFIDRLFDGSAAGLVSYVLRHEGISREDVERIRHQINGPTDGTTTEGRVPKEE